MDFHVTAWAKCLGALMLALCSLAMEPATARAEARSLKLRFLHTGETAEIVYKRNGRYDPAGLKKINYILRDWRLNESTRMDPQLLDLVWEAYRASDATGYIQVVSGYRAPATNAMLRSRSKGVARESQHLRGKALDFYIPGVRLKKLRDIGLKLQGGGVGYYPTSGSPFVHMDVGNVRHWPGISRQELARVFPSGKTLHVPSDGKPLPGYEQALAAYKTRKASGEPAIALASLGGSIGGKSRGFLTALFGGGADDNADVASASKASMSKPAAKELPGIAVVQPKDAQHFDMPQLAERDATLEPKQDTSEATIAALPARDIPVPRFASRSKTDVGAEPSNEIPFGMAVASALQVEPNADAGHPESGAVPLPSWRPEENQAPVTQGRPPVLLASAEVPTRASLAGGSFSVLPSVRPITSNARTDEVKVVLQKATTEQAGVAPLATPHSVLSSLSGVEGASTRLAVVERPAGADPAAAVADTVKTTRKEARAVLAGAKLHATTTVVAIPQVVRSALRSKEHIAITSDAMIAPRYAYNVVHIPPSEVYTAGFQSNDQMIDANRFTGNAVKFLPVARFQTVRSETLPHPRTF